MCRMAADTNHECWQAYVRGWTDGVTVRAMDSKFLEHPTRLDLRAEYLRGYQEGHVARKTHLEQAATRLNYVPSILREAV
jgi:hypothetical protein